MYDLHAFDSQYMVSLVFNGNIWPSSAALRDVSLQNLSDIDSDLSGSLRINVIASMDSAYMFSY